MSEAGQPGTERGAMRNELGYAIVDQAIVSAFNLGLSLAFIALTTPAEFGRFAVVQAALLIGLSLQVPLVLIPTNFLIPGREPAVQRAQISMLTSINAIVAAVAGGSGMAVAVLYGHGLPVMVALIVLFTISVLREQVRTTFFVHGKAARTLVHDMAYIAASLLAMVVLWQYAEPLTAVVWGMTMGSAVALAVARPALGLAPRDLIRHVREYGVIWRETRWSLLGSLQTEAQSRGYVYATELWRGPAAIGTVQAGRLILAPLALLAGAWGRVAQPSIVAALQVDDQEGAFRILRNGLAVMVALALAYGLVVASSWPLIERYVFGDSYLNMGGIVLAWWIYAVLHCASACLGIFVQARRQFRALAFVFTASSLTCLAGLLLLSFSSFPVLSVVYVLVGCEVVVVAGLVWIIGRSGAPFMKGFAMREAPNES